MAQAVRTIATLNRLRMSPRKVRLAAALIRGRRAAEARLQLQFARKAAARPILKLLQSAIANAAHNHRLAPESLVVKSVTVDGGQILYRWQPRAMGRATPIRKRTSHVTITLAGEVDTKKSKVISHKSKVTKSEVPAEEAAPAVMADKKAKNN